MIRLPAMLLSIVLMTALPVPNPDGRDYATIPPEPAEVLKQLSGSKVKLEQAIAIAQKETGGIARSAEMSLAGEAPAIEVLVYAGDKALRVRLDPAEGKVLAKTEVPRFPGEPVSGKWTETASGLKFFDLRVGSGAQPSEPTAQVKIHYTGWLVDGTIFDSSVERGDAYVNTLDHLIAGMREGLATMKVGGKRKLIIPYDLGYGVEGTDIVPGRAALIFDVELLEILG